MFDNVLQERTVTVHRERIGGLGLSVKGGAEHNLPVLISRIFKDQAGKSNTIFTHNIAPMLIFETGLFENAFH